MDIGSDFSLVIEERFANPPNVLHLYRVVYNAKQKHLKCKKGEANQKQQLSDYIV